MAADAGHCGGGAGRHLLQLPRCRRRPSRRSPTRCSPSRTTPGGRSSGSRCLRACSLCWAACSSPNRRAGSSAAASAEQALAALLRSRIAASRPNSNCTRWRRPHSPPRQARNWRTRLRDSLLQRKYVIPFLLACVILFCNTATGINSIIGYNTGILLQSGLSDLQAHWGYVLFTLVNFLMTMVGMVLVDRKGRKFLLILGTSGIIVSMVAVGMLFLTHRAAQPGQPLAVQALVTPDQELTLRFDRGRGRATARRCRHPQAADRQRPRLAGHHLLLRRFHRRHQLCPLRRSRRRAHSHHARRAAFPANKVEAFFKNPFANLDAARTAPLQDRKAAHRAGAQRAAWLAGGHRPLCLHGLLCRGPGRLRAGWRSPN